MPRGWGISATLGTLESAVYRADPRRLRLWGGVLGDAIIGTFLAETLGLAAPRAAFCHTIARTGLPPPASAIVAGLGALGWDLSHAP